MAYRGQGKWTEAPNVPYTVWKEPSTPNTPKTQFNPVNTGVQRNFDGEARWTPTGSSILAPAVAGFVTHAVYQSRAHRRQQHKVLMEQQAHEKEKEEINKKFGQPPQGRPTSQTMPESEAIRLENTRPSGMPVFEPTPKAEVERLFNQPPQGTFSQTSLPTPASEAGELPKGTPFPSPFEGTEATKNRPPLIDPTLTPEQVRRRRMSGGY